ncbi:ECF transporter S component [Desulfobacterales bacterium HSG2]|nr:ECF transporter S component [Desulfobacterales bacterium HSG2]
MKHQPIIIFMPIGIAVNIIGLVINTELNLPLFLDSIGTMLAAATMGPWAGALIGFLSNLIVGLFKTPINIPFGIVNAIIGIVVGYLSRKRGFEDLVTPLLASLILAVICPVIAAPIAVYLFGGVTGGNIDTFYAVLLESGYKIFSSAFLVRIPANLADKLISAYLVMAVIRLLPQDWKGIACSHSRADKRDKHHDNEVTDK